MADSESTITPKKRKPLTAEHRENIRLGMLGKKNALGKNLGNTNSIGKNLGNTHALGKNLGNTHALGYKHTDDARTAISLALTERTDDTRAAISLALTGRPVSDDTRAKIRAAVKLAFAEGRLTIPEVKRYTKLAQALHAHLTSTGLTLEPEIQFGRFTVDLYDREHHVAYEADGKYWHDKQEERRPGCGAARDAYLIQHHGLKVVHFTEPEIRALKKRAA